MIRRQRRREFLKLAGILGASAGAASVWPRRIEAQEGKRPNVILILTDDQGYGDLGCHGNDKIRTPNLDRIAREGVEFSDFHACPVCTPTRACLMTGRYNQRTRAIDTYLGRAMMDPDEVTIAEMLGAAGYRTGIFGKWHLGDNYPMRAMDQGFQESLVHHGGGIGQPSGPPGNTYFDPILLHNGRLQKYQGYCTDIFADAAIRFIEANRDRPFFVYLPTNAPHGPLQIADEYVAPYTAMGLDEKTAKVYGMITNIDENMGKLLEKLKALNLEENTLIIFTTDNGPSGKRYNCGLRAGKGSVYEGGIRVPSLLRWPGRLKPGRKIDRIAHMIDIAPTLLDLCGAKKAADVSLDGVSLMPLLLSEQADWPDRTLYFQWHRGDEPELYRSCAARSQRYKLVCPAPAKRKKMPADPVFELYDMADDPGEQNNIADRHPDVVEKMRKDYEAWFKDVGSTRGYAPPRIYLGTPHENPVTLTRQDWRGAKGWGDKDLGYWEVLVSEAGNYEISLRFTPMKAPGEVHFKLGGVTLTKPLEKGTEQCAFDPVALEMGEARLEARLTAQGKDFGVRYVDVKRLP